MKIKLFITKKSFLLLAFILLHNCIVFCQTSDFEKEKEVKTSGNYFWSQATALTDVEAKKQASELLWSTDEIKNNHNLHQMNIFYIVKQRGNKVLAIAYISKNGIKENSTNSSINANLIPHHQIILDAKNAQDTKPLESLNVNKAVVSNNYDDKTKQLSNSILINSLLDIDDINSVLKELNTFKMKGKIMYSSRIDAFDNSNQCYIIIYEETTNKILYLLDKGDETRVNLQDSKKINIKENQLINQLPKIYVYEF